MHHTKRRLKRLRRYIRRRSVNILVLFIVAVTVAFVGFLTYLLSSVEFVPRWAR